MTREQIENCEEDKIRTMSDFVAYCSYWDHDFTYEWKDTWWDKSGYNQIKYEKSRLHMWIPFDRLDILTSQVIGSSYFEDGNYQSVEMFCGGVFLGPDVIEDILEYLEMSPEDIDLTFPPEDIIYTYPELSSEEAIEKYLKKLSDMSSSENTKIDEKETL